MFWQNIDKLIALVLILGCLGLIASGIDSEVKSILTIAAGWAFGSTLQQRIAAKKLNHKK